AYPWNSWPSVTGVASMRWVRPALTTLPNWAALLSNVDSSCSSAGMRSVQTASVAARWIEDGNTSFDDWEALTWSFEWTDRPSSRRLASVAITSLAFILDEVPEPVWNVSIGNWSSYAPVATSFAAASMAAARAGSRMPSSALTAAAAALIRASALIWAG